MGDNEERLIGMYAIRVVKNDDGRGHLYCARDMITSNKYYFEPSDIKQSIHEVFMMANDLDEKKFAVTIDGNKNVKLNYMGVIHAEDEELLSVKTLKDIPQLTVHEVSKAFGNATYLYHEKYKNAKSYTGIGCPVYEPMEYMEFLASELNRILYEKMVMKGESNNGDNTSADDKKP